MQLSQTKSIEINTSTTEAWKAYESLYKYLQPPIEICNFIIGNFLSHKILQWNNSYFKCSTMLMSIAQPLNFFHINT